MMHMPKPWVTQARAWGRELRPYGRRALTVQVGTGQHAGSSWETAAGLSQKPVPSTRGAWPTGSLKGFYTLYFSWVEVGHGASCTVGLAPASL